MLVRTAVVLVMFAAVHKCVRRSQNKTASDIVKSLAACKEFIPPSIFSHICCGLELEDRSIKRDKPEYSRQRAPNIPCAFPENGEKWECHHAECILSTMGLFSYGKVDSKSWRAIDEGMFREQPLMSTLFEVIRKKCSQEYLMKFPVKHLCPAQKFYACFVITVIQKCKNWNYKDRECQRMDRDSRLCTKLWDKI